MKSSTKALEVFEGKEEEHPSEIESTMIFSKHAFTENAALGTNENSKETGEEPCVGGDAADGDVNGNNAHSCLDAEDCTGERMPELDNFPTITTTRPSRYANREPNNCIGGSFLPNVDNRTSQGTASPEILTGSASNDESIDTVSDVDESMSEKSASFASATTDNHDIFDGPSSSHHFDHRGMYENKAIVFCPDYLYYRGTSYAGEDTTVTLSGSCVEVKGSTMYGKSGTFSICFGVEDILQIQSQLSERSDVAVFKILIVERSTVQSEDSHETSGTEELEFAVNDCDLSAKCEAIETLDGYKAVWNFHTKIEERRENLHGETSNHPPKNYFPSYSEPYEVIYPKGDSDAVCISKRDFDLLEPDTFVNDTIIDFYIKYLKNGIPPENRQRYHFFNSFFFRKLADMDKDPTSAFDGRAAFLRVRKWTRKVSIFDKDFVIIPVNYNYHWSLVVICHPGEVANFTDDDAPMSSVKVPCILHMDSLRGSHAGLKDLLQRYLWEEWKDRTKETSEDVSSKFLNLRFLSLELPQQQNLSDCGLFLLHYVERFVEEGPACVSPYRIKNYHNEFLSVNWFQAHEPSIKRSAIQNLISNLLQYHCTETSPSCASDRCYLEDGPKSSNDDENAENSDNLQSSQASEITPFPASFPMDICASDSGLVLSGSFEPEFNEETLLDLRFDHSETFNEFKSSLPPIQEEVEGGVHLVCSSTETVLQHLGGNGSEPCAFTYVSKSLTSDTSWIPGVSVVQAVGEELDSSPTTTTCDTENPLEVEVGEPCMIADGNMSSDEKMHHSRLASANDVDCLLDGHISSGELPHITLAPVETYDHTESGHDVASTQENLSETSLQNDIHESGNLVCKRLLLFGSDSGSETDPQHSVKKMRLTPLHEEEVAFRSSLSHDLHL